MNTTKMVCAALLTTWCLGAAAGEATAPALDTDIARINYSLGYQIGGDFKRQNVKMDAAAIVRGIEDALSGGKPAIPAAEMNTMLVELKRRVVETRRAHNRELKAKYIAEGKAYMEKNGAKPGVVTTDSGLQYRIIEAGDGRKPAATDQVTVNYRGTTIAGVEFDSSYKRGEPASFPLNGVIRGWTEGLQKIGEGGRIELVIPPKLAYDRKGPLASQTLVFEVELLKVGPQTQAAADGASAKTATQ